jgi:hypothetical protein
VRTREFVDKFGSALFTVAHESRVESQVMIQIGDMAPMAVEDVRVERHEDSDGSCTIWLCVGESPGDTVRGWSEGDPVVVQ